jgi:hypothetical protein
MFEKPTTHTTEDDPLTISEMYEAIRINSLPESLQRLALSHVLDQWQASPDLVTRNAEELRRSSLRQ